MVNAFMDQYNNAAKCKVNNAHPQLLVGILGFDVADEEKLSSVFQIQRTNGRKYIPAKILANVCSDILVVNYDNLTALEEKDQILNAHPHTQIVAVSRGPLIDPPIHHIRGILIAARVLNVIDKVTVESSSELPSTPLQDVAEISPPQVPTTHTETNKTESTTTQINNGGYRVLVVDDSPAIQKSLEINLATLSQISVIDFADSGENALEKAEAHQYDLIFLDVMMPGMDGYEACSLLRKKLEYKKTPIIMVSGKTSPLDEVKGIVAGCTTYLTKPVQSDEFKKLSIRVLTWLENKKTS